MRTNPYGQAWSVQWLYSDRHRDNLGSARNQSSPMFMRWVWRLINSFSLVPACFYSAEQVKLYGGFSDACYTATDSIEGALVYKILPVWLFL